MKLSTGMHATPTVDPCVNLLASGDQLTCDAWEDKNTATASGGTVNLPAADDSVNPLGGITESFSAADVYTFACDMKGSGTVNLYNHWDGSPSETQFTLTSQWKRYSVTTTMSNGGTVFYPAVWRKPASGDTATSVEVRNLSFCKGTNGKFGR
jgi:hypothetical protein